MVYRKSKRIAYLLSMLCLATVVGCSSNSGVEQESNSNVESSHVYDNRTPQEILTTIQNSVASGDLESAVNDYGILLSVDKDSVMRTAQARDWIKEKYLFSGDIESAIELYDNVTDELILPEKEKLVYGVKLLEEARLLESEKKFELAAEKFRYLSSTYKTPLESYFNQRYRANTIELFKTMIRAKQYVEAYELSYSVREDSEVEILANYAYAKQLIKEGEEKWAITRLENIKKDYNGEFADEINAFKLTLKPQDYWYANHTDRVYTPSEPQIGSSKDAVRNSTWGEPKDINTTTTINGTSEQWVYGGGRYIYIDNGVVTVIQE